jgi:hypothetical protein
VEKCQKNAINVKKKRIASILGKRINGFVANVKIKNEKRKMIWWG